MARIIAIANQKGGVAKTTTTVNLGIGLARLGKRVLLVDADAQGSLTTSLGFQDPDNIDTALPEILEKIATDESVTGSEGLLTHSEGVDLIPSNIGLSAFEVNMANMMCRETILKTYVDIVSNDYDYILLDSMPSLGLVTINALSAADTAIIPVQTSYLPIKGLEQLIQTIGRVKRHLNASLGICGILMSMVDERTRFSRDLIKMLNDTYGSGINIFDTHIPFSVRVAECSAEGVSIYNHDPNGKAATAYESLIKEVLGNE